MVSDRKIKFNARVRRFKGKEEFPLDQFVEREIPRCILIFEPIEEC